MRRLPFVLVGLGLLGTILACNLLPSQQPPSPPPDLVATQVALVLTQTAIAAPPATSAPLVTPTAAAATPAPTAMPPTPTAAPPTPTARPVTPPYDGPCTPALTTSPVTPNPNDPLSFVGYRYGALLGTLFPEFSHSPRFGFLLNAHDLGVDMDDGFALAGYERPDLGVIALFFEKMVCRKADGGVYWEIVDALNFPLPTTTGDFALITTNDVSFAPGTLGSATVNLSMGWYASLECTPPLPTQPVASLSIDPASLPATIANGTRIPITVNAAWALDPFAQRFRTLTPASLSCVLEFHS